jgi:uncharacterized RDD family membrane protein YckC
MKKITELKEIKSRTIYHKDANGNKIPDTEEFSVNRIVKSVSAGTRFAHLIIDLITFTLIVYSINALLNPFVHFSNSIIGINLIWIIILLLIYPILHAICELIWQKTPGKFLTKTIVINEFGNKAKTRAIILRTCIRLVPFETFSCLGNKNNCSHGWHDKWTKTWVVTERELAILKKLQVEQSGSNATA